MLQAFIMCKGPIRDHLQEIDQDDLYPTKAEIDTIKSLILTLKTVEVGSQRLGKRGISLADADIIFEFMLNKLNQQNTDFAKEICAALEKRIKQRRLQDVSSLLAYLEDPHFLVPTIHSTRFLQYTTNKDVLAKLARDLILRLFPSDNVPITTVQEEPMETEGVHSS